jgi:hypothetical protein
VRWIGTWKHRLSMQFKTSSCYKTADSIGTIYGPNLGHKQWLRRINQCWRFWILMMINPCWSIRIHVILISIGRLARTFELISTRQQQIWLLKHLCCRQVKCFFLDCSQNWFEQLIELCEMISCSHINVVNFFPSILHLQLIYPKKYQEWY